PASSRPRRRCSRSPTSAVGPTSPRRSSTPPAASWPRSRRTSESPLRRSSGGAVALDRPAGSWRRPLRIAKGKPVARTAVGAGLTTVYLSLIVLIPLAAVVAKANEHGLGNLWQAVRTPEAWAALRLTVGASVLVALVNVVF